jgi:MCP family monocarboxylic acid transporter-like MFS transporter 14
MMVITQDALGEEKFNVAYGMLLFVEAVGVVCGSPLAGKANDVFGSYNLAFYLSGAVLVVSGKIDLFKFD